MAMKWSKEANLSGFHDQDVRHNRVLEQLLASDSVMVEKAFLMAAISARLSSPSLHEEGFDLRPALLDRFRSVNRPADTSRRVPLAILANGRSKVLPNPPRARSAIQGKEHYVIRDGLRIYLWEKFSEGQEGAFPARKIALLVHGGVRSGRPLFDLQIRDYSLMDFLAQNGYDVWAIDIHGYGHSDKTEKDWSDAHTFRRDIAAAVAYITKSRGVTRVNLLGCSAGTQRAGVFAMENPDKVAKLILYASIWKGTAAFAAFNRKRIENGGKASPSVSRQYGRIPSQRFCDRRLGTTPPV